MRQEQPADVRGRGKGSDGWAVEMLGSRRRGSRAERHFAEEIVAGQNQRGQVRSSTAVARVDETARGGGPGADADAHAIAVAGMPDPRGLHAQVPDLALAWRLRLVLEYASREARLSPQRIQALAQLPGRQHADPTLGVELVAEVVA